MVSMRQHRRDSDERHPTDERTSPAAVEPSPKVDADHHRKRHMKRREEVVRRIHGVDQLENIGKPPARMPLREVELERHRQEEDRGDEHGERHTLPEDAPIGVIATEDRRHQEEHAQREIRHQHPRHVRNASFPRQADTAELAARGGDPVRAAVDDQEQEHELRRRSCAWRTEGEKRSERVEIRGTHRVVRAHSWVGVPALGELRTASARSCRSVGTLERLPRGSLAIALR